MNTRATGVTQLSQPALGVSRHTVRGWAHLVTGAQGFLGRGLLEALARAPHIEHVVAVDVRDVPPQSRLPRVTCVVQVAGKVRGYLLALAFSLPASLLFTVYRSFNVAR